MVKGGKDCLRHSCASPCLTLSFTLSATLSFFVSLSSLSFSAPLGLDCRDSVCRASYPLRLRKTTYCVSVLACGIFSPRLGYPS